MRELSRFRYAGSKNRAYRRVIAGYAAQWKPRNGNRPANEASCIQHMFSLRAFVALARR